MMERHEEIKVSDDAIRCEKREKTKPDVDEGKGRGVRRRRRRRMWRVERAFRGRCGEVNVEVRERRSVERIIGRSKDSD